MRNNSTILGLVYVGIGIASLSRVVGQTDFTAVGDKSRVITQSSKYEDCPNLVIRPSKFLRLSII
jgi:hypothetical protein